MSAPVAIVLGARIAPDGTPSAAVVRRTRHAIALYRAGEVSHLVLSGAAFDGAPSEAAVMAQLCRAAGVPEVALTLEPRARTTRENLTFSAALVPGARRVVVTDAYHAARAALAARQLGLAVVLSCPPAPELAPRQRLKLALREALARLWYRLRYGRFSATR
ncbi:YdcF family protein [Rhodobacter lacus]|uniref:YdcF family protein n=1 Tax=Rhodobacter lacus TaxID=1641972 RepID=A0ABW5A9Y0_9RHOB